MFKCEVCKKSIGPAISPTMVVVETREKFYPAPKDGRDGRGYETVKEIKVCPNCK